MAIVVPILLHRLDQAGTILQLLDLRILHQDHRMRPEGCLREAMAVTFLRILRYRGECLLMATSSRLVTLEILERAVAEEDMATLHLVLQMTNASERVLKLSLPRKVDQSAAVSLR